MTEPVGCPGTAHTARVLVAAGEGPDRPAEITYRTRSGAGPRVGELATLLGTGGDRGLTVDGRALAATRPLLGSGLAHGSRVATRGPLGASAPAATRWRLAVVGGPGTGRHWPLPCGATSVGAAPAADIQPDAPGPDEPFTVYVHEDGSAAVVTATTTVQVAVGEPFHAASRAWAVLPTPVAPARPVTGTTLRHHPTARAEPPAPDGPPEPPAAPPEPAPPRLSWVGVAGPLLFGVVVAVMWSVRFALFALLGPLLVLGSWVEQRRRHRRERRVAREDLERSRREHEVALARHRREQARVERRCLPSFGELEALAAGGGPGLWSRPDGPPTVSAGWDGSRPHGIRLLDATTVISGPPLVAQAVARHLVLQLVVSTPPSTVALLGEEQWDADRTRTTDDRWLGWLPHRVPAPDEVGVGRAPVRLELFGPGRPPSGPPAPGDGQLVVLAVGAERPPWATTALHVDHCSRARVERREDGRTSPPLLAAPIDRGHAARVARHLARWWEATADEPRPRKGPVALGELVDDLTDPGALARRWVDRPGDRLPAPLGVGVDGPTTVDLVADGPHAVIGGTTGSGKSELLRTLVAGLAALHPPEALALVLVDYKGGSTFDGCARLPQVVDVVTDLDGSRTDRVLAAVDLELERRERWLRHQGCVDLTAAAEVAGRPPRLVVVVDEFATLARDRPDTLPTLVDLARRGRSLGLHLVLATQRPAGAMTDDIRANTDLRVALRTVDGADSTDVVGVPDAVHLPVRPPGQAVLRRAGVGVEHLRVATTGAAAARSAPDVEVRWLDREREPDEAATAEDSDGPTELERLVEATAEACRRAGHRPVEPLWPPELPADVRPGQLPATDDGDPGAVLGLVDDLAVTEHRPCRWEVTQGLLTLFGSATADLSAVVTGVVAAVVRCHPEIHVYAVADPTALGDWDGAGPVAGVVPPTDRDRLRHLLTRLEQGRGGPTGSLLVVHDHGGIVHALDDLEGLRLLDRLHRLGSGTTGRGPAVVVTGTRPGALPSGLAGSVARRLVLRLAQRDDYRLAGLAPPDVPLVSGRALDEAGRLVQLARLDPGHLAHEVGEPRGGRPRPLLDLPDRVAVAGLGPSDVAGPWVVPIGLTADGPAALTLARDRATLVSGPPGSGRTTTLRALGVGLRSAGVATLTVGVDVPPDGLGALLGVADPLVLLVDDATDVDDPGGLLADLARGRNRPDGVRVVVACDPVERRSAYGHWTAVLRRARTGIALHHDPEEDGDLWAVPLPAAPRRPRPPGRGLLLTDGADPVPVQVAEP